ncbi:MAG: amino acid decarboxylase [Acidobacteria bacterium]|nr:amino acid decarboxylase [Acidobacteriota bacterium]
MTFDPPDWSAFAAQAHAMLDDILGHLAALPSRPAWQPVPSEVRQALNEPLPRQPQGLAAAHADFQRLILPYTNGNIHPRFWAWVQGAGDPHAMLATMLAAGLNPMLAGFHQSPALVEAQVLRWLAQLMGFPDSSSGLLCSSGTAANLIGLAVARHAKAGYDLREEGLSRRPPFVVYCSTETHGWARKAVEFLGIGHRHLRRIPADDHFRLQPHLLRKAILQDRAEGHHPVAVIATAGTVNTGAIDPLPAIAGLCAEERLWFHVDGAFGALARWSPALAPLVEGLERADSLAFDLHKWGSLPFSCACLLTRHPELHRSAFALTPPYMTPTQRGILAGGVPFADLGIDLTRPFTALQAWLCFKTHGLAAYAASIEQNVRQVRRFEALLRRTPGFEILAPSPLNVLCFRFAPPSLSDLDALNHELLLRLQESGRAVVSSTLIHGRFALRLAHVNHRSTDSDFDELLQALQDIAKDLP